MNNRYRLWLFFFYEVIMKEEKKKAPCARCDVNNTALCDPGHCNKYLKWLDEYRKRK